MNRQIWIFREPRSGSTWFVDELSKVMSTKGLHVKNILLDHQAKHQPTDGQYNHLSLEEKNNQKRADFFSKFNEPQPSFLYEYLEESGKLLTFKSEDYLNSVMSTHQFSLLEQMKHYSNPILIRTTRNNITEQFISHWIASRTHWSYSNLHGDSGKDKESFAKAFNLIVGTGNIIRKQNVERFVKSSKKMKLYWDTYASSYDNCTITYEDMVKGFDIPLLGLSGLQMQKTANIAPLLYDKRKIVLNYDQVDSWIKEMW